MKSSPMMNEMPTATATFLSFIFPMDSNKKMPPADCWTKIEYKIRTKEGARWRNSCSGNRLALNRWRGRLLTDWYDGLRNRIRCQIRGRRVVNISIDQGSSSVV